MRRLLLLGLGLLPSLLCAETKKAVFNPFTGKQDYITRIDSNTAVNVSTLTVSGPLTVTNAQTSGVAGTASQIKTGDPNTVGLVVQGNTFTPASVTPSNVTGLVGWYRPEELAWKADGVAVSSWTDASGNSNTITDGGTGAFDPVFKTNIKNGQSVVRFDNSNDNLNCTSVTGGLTTVSSIFFAIKPDSVSTIDRELAHNSNRTIVFRITSTGNLTFFAGSFLTTTATLSPGTWYIVSVVRNGTTAKIYINGTESASGSVGSNSFANYYGVSYSATGQFYGDMAESIVYNTAVSDSNRGGIEAYLSAKYAITIAGSVSQVSNLQNWNNSIGSVLSNVDGSGNHTTAQTFKFLNSVSTTTAPAAANLLAVNSASELYISTGTGAGAWVKVGGQ